MDKKVSFEEWAKDFSRSELVKDVTFPGNVALLEVYKIPSSKTNSKVDLIVSAGKQGGYKRESEKVEFFIKPIAKVLKLGNGIGPDYEEMAVGGLVYLPDTIKNTTWNPEFLMLLQEQRGNMEPKLPATMNKEIAVFNKLWGERMYQIDKLGEPTTVDTMTYLVPLNSIFIQAIKK